MSFLHIHPWFPPSSSLSLWFLHVIFTFTFHWFSVHLSFCLSLCSPYPFPKLYLSMSKHTVLTGDYYLLLLIIVLLISVFVEFQFIVLFSLVIPITSRLLLVHIGLVVLKSPTITLTISLALKSLALKSPTTLKSLSLKSVSLYKKTRSLLSKLFWSSFTLQFLMKTWWCVIF